jgi:hypothetical protein
VFLGARPSRESKGPRDAWAIGIFTGERGADPEALDLPEQVTFTSCVMPPRVGLTREASNFKTRAMVMGHLPTRRDKSCTSICMGERRRSVSAERWHKRSRRTPLRGQ